MTRIPVTSEAGKAREDELRNDHRSANRRRRGMALFGGKKDTRPVDEGIASLHGKSESELVEWWKQRFALIAEIPSDTARVGALTPQLRELSRIDDREERKRVTRARMIALPQLDAAKRERIAEARKRAWDVDRGVLEADQEIVDELLPTLDQSVRDAYPAAKA
jgi:hypothetical protein